MQRTAALTAPAGKKVPVAGEEPVAGVGQRTQRRPADQSVQHPVATPGEYLPESQKGIDCGQPASVSGAHMQLRHEGTPLAPMVSRNEVVSADVYKNQPSTPVEPSIVLHLGSADQTGAIVVDGQ